MDNFRNYKGYRKMKKSNVFAPSNEKESQQENEIQFLDRTFQYNFVPGIQGLHSSEGRAPKSSPCASKDSCMYGMFKKACPFSKHYISLLKKMKKLSCAYSISEHLNLFLRKIHII